jgi:hypothetical protein
VIVYVADCNNHCIRKIFYDVGDAKTVEFKNIPSVVDNKEKKGPISKSGSGIDNEETEGTTTNKSGNEGDMELECDGNQCYPKFF